MEKEKIYPFISLLGGILAVSTAAILIRFAQDQAPSLVIASVRLFVATIVISPIAFLKYKSKLFNIKRTELIFLVLAGLFLAIHFAVWIFSLELTSIASSVVLVTTTPLWVALFSPIFLKEKNNSSIWFGLFLAIIGSSLVALSNQCELSLPSLITCKELQVNFNIKMLLGNFLALFGAWMAAGYLMAGRKVRTNVPLIVYIFYVYLFATIFLLVFTGFSGQKFTGYSNDTYVYLILLGLIPQLLGHTIFNWALGHLPAVFVSIALIGEPIGTIILAFLFLKESPKNMEYLGGFLILLGIFVVSFINSQKTKE